MAERKATNKYYPPQWTPDQGSLNTFHGSHPLRERARKLHEGIIGVRFELPYNIWCNGCGSHVGMGVRYNAEKSRVGSYYSTPIFKFRMKCHLCDNYFEIQTDPKNCDYVVVEGASRKNERWEHTEGETVSVQGEEKASLLATDAMYRLEHHAHDKEKAKDAAPRIARIMEIQEDKLDDFTLNQTLRKNFRNEKKELKKKSEEDQKVQQRTSISIPLVEEKKEDILAAKKVAFVSETAKMAHKQKRLQAKTRSIFGTGSPSQQKAEDALRKACLRMDGSIFDSKQTTHATKSGLRDKLGVKKL